ncbi:uncharacterized protein LOC117918379 isoform X2 [Vitis riparia]|uniref:uncharacterized protein LOC117918379 isoform X2 n=1 Tax=Vitis riparia TaxID=96939 RepID=UPI00155A1780|nr:uncharacterized protein LOC117918379 isoform X2 [Vitis riparia]XP_034690880.1 uncharacterized protein LOC117918379 isoform X2 [Vitis riparia]XP_034690881.1 uncharacterized protein LOC117918379 isoform X2 [Vitis riparia]XP_034690882.1 uncharacterized protein LOC117918379 isoform X2 [Vitis riparia]
MGFEDFEAIFGEAKPEWANESRRFLFHFDAIDPSRLRIRVTDFHSSTWEAVRSVEQLEDMRDTVGIGGSWSEFVDYVIASIKSEDVKLVLEENAKSDGAAYAKLVAQKSKGMPLISFSLAKLANSAASEAMMNLSLELFKSYRNMQNLFIKEQECSDRLAKALSAEQGKNESMQGQLELSSRRQKLQKTNTSDKTHIFASLVSSDTFNGLQNSPDKLAAQSVGSTKVTKHVVPAYRRVKARGALLQDIEDKDN